MLLHFVHTHVSREEWSRIYVEIQCFVSAQKVLLKNLQHQNSNLLDHAASNNNTSNKSFQ